MQKTKRRIIIYWPGIISLMLLPLLFIYFSRKGIKERTWMTVKITFASSSGIIDHPTWYEGYDGHIPPVRNYQNLIVTGEVNSDKALVHAAHLKIAQLVALNDTLNGLHFIFSNNASYGTFVQLVDILKTEGAKTFMPIDNELWFYNFPPQVKGQEYHYFLCGTGDHVIYLSPSVALKNQVIIAWANGKEIISCFAFFVIAIVIFRRRRPLIKEMTEPNYGRVKEKISILFLLFLF